MTPPALNRGLASLLMFLLACDTFVVPSAAVRLYRDADGDGYGSDDLVLETTEELLGWVGQGGDCDDGDASIHPGAQELCDQVDQDCDGLVDEDASDPVQWYVDADGDGFGWSQDSVSACQAPSGYVAGSHDCDDADPAIHPGAEELCDGVDQDCDGQDPCVDCDWIVPAQVDTIQGAIDSASDWQQICVDRGTWQETLDFSGKLVEVTGVFGPQATIIDGTGEGPVVSFHSGETSSARLQGFTIRNGQAENGAGLSLAAASPDLVDLVLEDNEASEDGGAIWAQNAHPHMEDLVMEANSAGADGGGIFFDTCTVDLLGVDVRGNQAGSRGGAIFTQFSSGTVEQSWFVDNQAATEGGALFLGGSIFQLDNLVLDGNRSLSMGGGIRSAAELVELTHALIVDNASEDYGGGIFVCCDESAMALQNVILARNSADLWGGGMMANSGGLDLLQVSFVENAAAKGGALMLYHSGSHSELRSVDFSFNEASEAISAGSMEVLYPQNISELLISYSNFYMNDPQQPVGIDDPVGGDGNIAVDPGYLDRGSDEALYWDLHLGVDSLLRDSGPEDLWDPDGSRSDIGAWGGEAAGAWDLDGDGWNSWYQPGEYDAESYPDLDCDDLDSSVFPGSGC